MEETNHTQETIETKEDTKEKKKTDGAAKNKKRGGVSKGILYELLILGIKISAIVGVFVVVFTLIFGLFRVGDMSMYPAIKDGDLVMYYRFDKRYVATDTVAISYDGETQARRVIAIEGDTVDIREGKLYVNGAPQCEKDVQGVTDRYESDVEFPLTVQEGEIFVLGDSREYSTDSRIYGCVPINKTLGKVTMIMRTRRP